jgi:Domain of unknown function (DUF5916)/Carbohydrate family 9 binding domain-like
MRTTSRTAIFIALMAVTAVAAAGRQAPPQPPPPAAGPPGAEYVVEPRRLSQRPVIDGKLDDPVWQQATLIAGFTQFEPDNGKPATERTEVRVGYDAEYLYFAVHCYDREPDKIVANTMLKDGDLSNEDSIEIMLDTFHDRSSAFLFSVNPLNAKVDALIRREGEDINYYWDGLWDAATSRDASGWSAEIAIPFKTLRFPSSASQVWGFNVRRFIARRQEDDMWKPMRVVGNTYFEKYKVSRFGELRGLTDIRSAGRYQAVPYGLIKDQHDQNHHGLDGNGGGDLKVNLTSQLVLDLTARTDFAEAESDLQQINLTPFKIQYPEKRAFFLEGSNLFYFGDRGARYEANERFNFFFSRQIGLTPDGTQEVPLYGGAKMTGEAERLGVGFLNLTTAPLTYRDGTGQKVVIPEANYTVLRLKQDVFENSSVGLIGLAKEAAGDHNAGAGLDWNLGLLPHLSSAGFYAQTFTPGLRGDDRAEMADLLYFYGPVRAWTEYAQYGQNFNPEIGFLTRTGIRKSTSDLSFFLHPDWGPVHRLTIVNDFDHITDETGQVLSQIWKSELAVTARDNSGVALLSTSDLEVLRLPFTVHRGVTIPVGEYQFRDIFVGFNSDFSRPISFTAWYDNGRYYDGTKLHNLLALNFRIARGLVLQTTYDRTQVHLREGRFVDDLAYTNLVYSFTPTMFVRGLVQWLRGDNFGGNLLFDWTYRPGSDIYLVWNDVRDLDPQRQDLPFSPVFPGWSLTLKVSHRFDF